MALSAKLELRQSQTLVMTPQLQQAIKLLQLSNIELSTFVEAELERNPLLERAEAEHNLASQETPDANREAGERSNQDEQSTDEWLNHSNQVGPSDPTGGLDTDLNNVFPDIPETNPTYNVPDPGWTSISGKARTGIDDVNLEAFVAEDVSLQDHLTEQLHLAVTDPVMRLIAQHLIDMVDESGYLRGHLDNLSQRLGAPLDLIEDTLTILQGFDPAGIFARNLEECLALQLKEQNRYDPAIAGLIENLHLLAAHDFGSLKRICGADDEDLADMISEIKKLNPKPGLRFGNVTVQPVVPDVMVRQQSDGSWHVELNSETLPKVLVNQTYYTTVSKTTKSDKDQNYLLDCLQTANWLVKSLDQRARTILKVAEEIVRQQDTFLTHGVQHLRPLNLKTVADAISMHESTVSRVTSNKYMATNRGIFELKYFFTSAIASSGAGEAHSSEAVRHRIKQLIDNETSDRVLSDDKIVEKLRADGIDIARRTVAKYREAMRIPSSVQRRREKKMAEKTNSL